MAFKVTLQPIDSLIEYEDNPRQNEEAVTKVADSIQEFGFKVPIVVDEDSVILAGHTRLKAARLLGLNKVPVHVATDLTEEQRNAFRIMDNKSSEAADWDNELLSKEFQKLAETDWTAMADVTMADNMKTYRQALRDLPTHSNWPNLEDADWPTKPS